MRSALFTCAVLTCVSHQALAQRVDVTIPAARDVTLFQDSAGQLTNDHGPGIFVGNNAFGEARRAMLAFDVAAHVPANAHIVYVQLLLTVSQSPFGAQPVDVTVHRVTNTWPEGSTAASGAGGAGTQAVAGDVTWLYRPFPATPWATPGGDFDPAPSGTFSMPANGVFALGSSTGMVADVQAWLDGTLANNGWLLKTDEVLPQTARRLHSRETTFVGVDPQLQIGYVAAGTTWSRGQGCLGSNGQRLRQTVVGAPISNTTISVVITGGIPLNYCATLLSATLSQFPVDLVPGCPYELGAIWFDHIGPLRLDAQGGGVHTLALPDMSAFLGVSLGFQTAAFDLGVPYAITASNGTVAVFR